MSFPVSILFLHKGHPQFGRPRDFIFLVFLFFYMKIFCLVQSCVSFALFYTKTFYNPVSPIYEHRPVRNPGNKRQAQADKKVCQIGSKVKSPKVKSPRNWNLKFLTRCIFVSRKKVWCHTKKLWELGIILRKQEERVSCLPSTSTLCYQPYAQSRLALSHGKKNDAPKPESRDSWLGDPTFAGLEKEQISIRHGLGSILKKAPSQNRDGPFACFTFSVF